MFCRIQIFALLMFTGHAVACSCVDVQPFCNALPDPADTRTAIFVGIVKDVYPGETVQDYLRAVFPNAPKSGNFTPEIEDLRNGLLRVWHGVLSPEEEARLKNGKSERDLEEPLKGMFWSMPRRVQFDVMEKFTGVDHDRFELFTGIGGGDCGVGFRKGESFLVVARRDPATGRWSSSICSRTRSVQYADSDLAALRAWKRGDRLRPKVYGTLEDWTNRGDGWGVGEKPLVNTTLQLRSDDEKHEATTDLAGRFVFEDLSNKIYQLDADLPGWRFLSTSNGRRKIDLKKAACSELFLTMEELQGEIKSRLLSDSGKLPGVLWVEAIPVVKDGRLKSRTGGTKPDGSFVIDAIEPGDYVVALDVEHPPTTEHGRNSKYERLTPYPPMYFPGTSEPDRAQVFHVDRGQVIDLPAWKLPEPSKERSINGVVLWPNRKPAANAKVVLTVASTGVDSMRLEQIRNDGSFTLFGLEGLPYRIRAAAYDANQKFYFKGSLEVLPEMTSVVVVLEPDGSVPSDRSFFRNDQPEM